MRIGIYGGTFNPIHRGHTALAKSLVRQGLVDEVWLMVSPQNPLKDNDAASYADRFAMAQIATKYIKGVIASDFENHLPIPSYTITTLNSLKKTYPQHTFSLVIGADNWQRFSQWYKADEILAQFPILIFQRPGTPLPTPNSQRPPTNDQRLSTTIQTVNTPLYDISSTEIRRRVLANEPLTNLVNKKVERYIYSHSLYNHKKE